MSIGEALPDFLRRMQRVLRIDDRIEFGKLLPSSQGPRGTARVLSDFHM